MTKTKENPRMSSLDEALRKINEGHFTDYEDVKKILEAEGLKESKRYEEAGA